MLGLTLAQSDCQNQSPCWWDAPVFAGLAFRPTKNGGWKERALCFLGHHYLLLSVIIPSLCPRALMATMTLLSQNYDPVFAAAHIFRSDPAHFLFFLIFFSHAILYAICPLWLGCWRLPGELEAEEKKRRRLWEKKGRKQAFFFFLCIDSQFYKQNPSDC